MSEMWSEEDRFSLDAEEADGSNQASGQISLDATITGSHITTDNCDHLFSMKAYSLPALQWATSTWQYTQKSRNSHFKIF